MDKHRLIIMRHAKSDRSDEGLADFDRPLAKRGVEAIPKMAAWLRKNKLVPGRIISSPALRARQTAEWLATEIGFDVNKIIWDERIYDASLSDLLQVIETGCGDASHVLIVGHNPGFDTLLEHLSSTPPPRNGKGKLLTTAALAVLDYGARPIRPAAGCGKLLHLVRPSDL